MNPARTLTRTVLACLAVTAVVATTVPAAAARPGQDTALAAQSGLTGLPGLPGLTGLTGLPGLDGPAGRTGLLRPAAAAAGHVYPLWRLARPPHSGPGPASPAGPAGPAGPVGAPGGYSPSSLRAYLGLRGTGAGQTIAITEAFNVQHPLPVATYGQQDDITGALAAYDNWYGLPPVCPAHGGARCFRLRFTAPHGIASVNASDNLLNWIVEAQLDVETIHALVPLASIVVVEGHDDKLASMTAAASYARGLHPAAVSDSWTGDEFAREDTAGPRCTAAGPPCVFSSGDCGSYRSSTCAAGGIGGFPAADPAVLAVGGTSLSITPAGRVLAETAWSGSGGGVSRYEPVPRYQRAADPWHGGRGVPDVSFDADPSTGVAIYEYLEATVGGQQFFLLNGWDEAGGTSVGAPAWAAIIAAADQLRAAAGKPRLTAAGLQAAVYARPGGKPVADISTGVNGLCRAVCQARRGYDLVTGEGSPRRGIASYLARR